MSTRTITNRGRPCVRTDPSQIPAIEVPHLGTAFLGVVQRFYEDPENLRRFEEWKRKKDMYMVQEDCQ